jgi:phosphoribosylformimino-5-aminoimidazole carboxamide ribotide isomerase
MEIIPAIDIMDGRCVRLTEGDYSTRKQYHANPVEVAKSFEEAGIRRLHVVDLDGARAGKVVNLATLESICSATSMVVDFGGGVRSDEDLQQVFDAGAAMVTCGSVAVKDPDLAARWIARHGGDRLILGADVKNGRIAVSGWEEQSRLDLMPFLSSYLQMGYQHVICTDISKDGKLQGPSTDLYHEIIAAFPAIRLIASGGITTAADLEALKRIGTSGAIIGKAIYEGYIQLSELQSFIA